MVWSGFVKINKSVCEEGSLPPPAGSTWPADGATWPGDGDQPPREVASLQAGVAVFDFDRTLIRSGSLLPLLHALIGFRRLALGCLIAGGSAVTAGREKWAATFRSRLLHETITGRTIADLESAAERAFPLLRWRDEMLREYMNHRRAGRAILVASGGIACCVRRLLALKRIDVDGVLATELTDTCGVLTGEIDGLACTGGEKARRIEEWLGGVPCTVWGYGNLPSDAPMLSLAHHPTCVGKHRIWPMPS